MLEKKDREDEHSIQVWSRRRGQGAYESYIESFAAANVTFEASTSPPPHFKSAGDLPAKWGIGPANHDFNDIAFQLMLGAQRLVDGSNIPSSHWGSFADAGYPVHQMALPVFSLADPLACLVEKIYREPAPYTSGSPGRMELATTWMANCLRDHDNCSKWEESDSFVPTRLIDLQPDGGSGEPCLWDTQGSVQPYICLSHRWGGSKVLTTTSETLHERMNAIPIASMPTTFRDAVDVTKKLGFRFLWIDSLCIQQDLIQDWENEAAKMGQIYRHAKLTIVAAAATDADSGCFVEMTKQDHLCRLPSKLGVAEAPRNGETSCDQTTSLFAAGLRTFVAGKNMKVPFKRPSALDSRAWVLQERVLSPRSLIFAEDGLYWECNDLEASDAFPEGLQAIYAKPNYFSPQPEFLLTWQSFPREFRQLMLGGLQLYPDQTLSNGGYSYQDWMQEQQAQREQVPEGIHYRVDETGSSLGEASQGPIRFSEILAGFTHSPFYNSTDLGAQYVQAFTLWNRVVEDYTSRLLTHESDRLLAIQGLAGIMESYQHTGFIFGLRRREIARDLTWRVDDTGELVVQSQCDCITTPPPTFRRGMPQRQPPGSPIAPSWSWASINQRVRYWEDLYVSQTIQPIENDDTAFEQGSWRLILKGILRPVRVMSNQERSSNSEQNTHSGKVCDPEDPHVQPIGKFWPDVMDDIDEVLLCMPVALYAGGFATFTGRETGQWKCLILRPTKNCALVDRSSKILEFTRVGVADIKHEYGQFLGLYQDQQAEGETIDDYKKRCLKTPRPLKRDMYWSKKPVMINII